jgi:predicted nicotinamide N-methyase
VVGAAALSRGAAGRILQHGDLAETHGGARSRAPMPGYLTLQQDVAIDGGPDLVIRSLLDRQQYADPLGEAAALGIGSAAWPLFGLLWPSGAQLAAHMVARPPALGLTVLEIGCGLALASLACHRLGVDITASDRHPLAEAFLRANLALNGLGPLRYRHGDWNVAAPAGAAPAMPRRRVAGHFDLIIGSDLLYERDAGATLAAFIGLHAGPAGEVRIVDPDRGNRPAFNRQMAEQGFELREERLDRVATAGAEAYKGRLLTYRRRDAQDEAPAAPTASPPHATRTS